MIPKPSSKEDKQKMAMPFVAIKCPYRLQLIPNKEYSYCTCGLSTEQPFCDGFSHQHTQFKPILFTAKNQKYSFICGCRRNEEVAKPYCDGNHRDIDW